jgi:hypothetical protein
VIVWRDGRSRTVCDSCFALAPEPLPADWHLGRRVLVTAPDPRVDELGNDVARVVVAEGPRSSDDDRRPTVVPVAACPDCQGDG